MPYSSMCSCNYKNNIKNKINFYIFLEESEHCDINGLLCLNAHYAELSVLKKKNSKRPGLECHCVASCIESEIDVITVETFV